MCIQFGPGYTVYPFYFCVSVVYPQSRFPTSRKVTTSHYERLHRDKGLAAPVDNHCLLIVGEAENPKKGPTNLPVINTQTFTGYENKYGL